VQVGNQAMADRYTYVPLIGVFLMLTWGVSDLARAWRLPRSVLAAGTTAVLAACIVLTRAQAGHWKDDLSLYAHTIAVTEGNVLAHYNLGKALKDLGRPAEAEAEYRAGLSLAPTDARIHNNLGNVLTDLGRREEAMAEFRQAIALDFETALPHLNLGRALLEVGRFTEALASFERGHELGSRDPHWPYPSAEWVREAKWFVEWDRKLPAVSVQMATILGRG
jgi:tetratricopeptide (TPR) repeat protein